MKKIYLKHETDTLRDDDIVIVSDMDFFRQLESVLSRWNRNGIIQNYMGWRMLQRIGYLASDEFRKSELDFMKEQTGIEKQQDMDRRCLDLLSDTAPDLVGRTYVDHFFTVSDKAIANSMIQQVLLRFKEIIKQKDWMDARTQTNSMAKAAQITVNTGFPDWLMNNTQLQQEYDFVSIISRRCAFHETGHVIAGRLRGRQHYQHTPQNVPLPYKQSFPQVEEACGPIQRMANGCSDSERRV